MKNDQRENVIKRSQRSSFLCLALLGLTSLVALNPAYAQQGQQEAASGQSASAEYSRYYGTGLRQFSEGEFSEAASSLLRAYALDSKASTMQMVVRAYDELGFCDAAARQNETLKAVHPQAARAELKRCANPGQLELQCLGVGGPVLGGRVVVDGKFRVDCGRVVSLPPGEHQLLPETRPRVEGQDAETSAAETKKLVELKPGEQSRVELKFFGPPIRWKIAGEPEVGVLSDLRVRVDRLEAKLPDYSVYLTEDGLYRVILRPGGDSVRPSARPFMPLRPEVLRLCDSGERFDPQLYRCVPIKRMKVPKFD